MISPGQSNNSSRQDQNNSKRPSNHIERNIRNKQHNSQNHPDHRKNPYQIFPCRNTSHKSQSFPQQAPGYMVSQRRKIPSTIPLRSAEGEALCRGSGPRIRGMQKRVPKNSFLIFFCRLLASCLTGGSCAVPFVLPDCAAGDAPASLAERARTSVVRTHCKSRRRPVNIDRERVTCS